MKQPNYNITITMEKALRETQTLRARRALAVVRFGHRPPARYKHTRTRTQTDRTDYNTLRR